MVKILLRFDGADSRSLAVVACSGLASLDSAFEYLLDDFCCGWLGNFTIQSATLARYRTRW